MAWTMTATDTSILPGELRGGWVWGGRLSDAPVIDMQTTDLQFVIHTERQLPIPQLHPLVLVEIDLKIFFKN